MIDDGHLPEPHGPEENVGPVKGEVALHADACTAVRSIIHHCRHKFSADRVKDRKENTDTVSPEKLPYLGNFP
jgi:hypothetical protein